MIAMPTVLHRHTSEKTAYIVDDYPYGFHKRCKMRIWIETHPEKGQRVCSQTTNPDKAGNVWNKVKKSTYTQIRTLYLEINDGHVKHDALSLNATKVEVDAYIKKYGAENFTDEYSAKTLGMMRTYRHLLLERFAHKPEINRVDRLLSRQIS